MMQGLLMLWHTNSSTQWLSLFTSAVLLHVRCSCLATQREGGGSHTAVLRPDEAKTVFLPCIRLLSKNKRRWPVYTEFWWSAKIQFGVTEHNNHRDYLSDRPRVVGATSLDCSCCHAHWAYSCMNVWGSANKMIVGHELLFWNCVEHFRQPSEASVK